jgi:NAD(P)H-dependent flavin oxidoreductase YrpB (nitropropane dioxygenase family)
MDVLDRLRLDVPVLQAGMGGGIAGPELAAAVAAAGGLGTLGLADPAALRAGADRIREQAPGRAVAVNLLMPFVRRSHVEACVAGRVDVAVLFYGGDAGLVRRLHDAGVLVLSQVGTREEATTAVGWGVDALIAQGAEAGGHLLGRAPALSVLEVVRAVAGSRPVFVAGGVADAADTARALGAGAAGVVAGTRFLLTSESRAHPLYRRRVLEATETLETTLFGLAWPARHRVVPNAATRRWLRPDGSVRGLPDALNRMSGPLGRVATDAVAGALPRLQRARLPLLSPTPPRAGLPDAAVESTPLYAGETALRIDSVVPAAEAVRLLAGSPV